MVAICTVQNPTEAEILRSALQAGGFACYIGGEGQSGFAGVFAIDVLTSAEDADAATKYLRKLKKFNKHLRKQQRDAKEAKPAEKPSEGIQEPNRGKKKPEADG